MTIISLSFIQKRGVKIKNLQREVKRKPSTPSITLEIFHPFFTGEFYCFKTFSTSNRHSFYDLLTIRVGDYYYHILNYNNIKIILKANY